MAPKKSAKPDAPKRLSLEAPLVNFRSKVDHCNPVYVLATASAATLLGSGSGRFRQGSHEIEARKLHLR